MECIVNGEKVPCPEWLVNSMPIILLASFACIAIIFVSSWIIYKKAGQPGWAIFIPFYNVMVLLRMVALPMWHILLLFIPLVNIVVCIRVYVRLAERFGKGIPFACGMIFLPFIFFPLLAFGSSVYSQPVPRPISQS